MDAISFSFGASESLSDFNEASYEFFIFMPIFQCKNMQQSFLLKGNFNKLWDLQRLYPDNY